MNVTTSMNLIGRVCSCSKGEVGLVTGRDILPWGRSWIGIPLNRTGKWASRTPVVIAYSLPEYLRHAPVKTYTFQRTQTVEIRMLGEGDDFEGEPIHWDSPEAQRDAALEWANQCFLDEDYCEEHMEAETTEWELVGPKPPPAWVCWRCAGPWPCRRCVKP